MIIFSFFLVSTEWSQLGGDGTCAVRPEGCLTFQGYDLAGGVHDGAVGRDGPADRRVGVCHVNDHHLSLLANFLTDADELVRLHG